MELGCSRRKVCPPASFLNYSAIDEFAKPCVPPRGARSYVVLAPTACAVGYVLSSLRDFSQEALEGRKNVAHTGRCGSSFVNQTEPRWGRTRLHCCRRALNKVNESIVQ